jgi:DNA helicase-2/ATP-dependent DNA helicase PcrA
MTDLQLRPAQAEILKYENGRLAISAVPGSGKTFTLSLLAAQLIANGSINADAGQQILIVTYLNASVDTFKARIRKRLDDMDLPPVGFDVRTLHSLALEIVRLSESGLGEENTGPEVLDDVGRDHALTTAVSRTIDDHPEQWLQFLSEDTPQMRARWRDITERTARTFIRTAKNERYTPEMIQKKLETGNLSPDNATLQSPVSDLPITESPLLWMMTAIYARYQQILIRQGAMDFDDLIWQAVNLLENRPGFAEELYQRWPYVLEDEAQDSVPLQEVLLTTLTGSQGNWVRVGDPNQAITSTFTAAHPRFFNTFSDRPDVVSLPLPNSGRSAPLIIGAANTMLDWVIDKHPVEEVRQHTFRRQHILPTPPGDAQPNPPDSQASIRIKVYKHREDEELPKIARLAHKYSAEKPDHTLAILVPTNQTGYMLADHLDELGADYDNMLRGGSHEREIAAGMQAILGVLADPLSTKTLVSAHAALHELEHPAAACLEDDLPRLHTILRSVHKPETLLFPTDEAELESALPAGVAQEEDIAALYRFAAFLQHIFDLRTLPIDDLALSLGDELFARGEIHEVDLAIAYQIGSIMRHWRDTNPDWRLPELVAQLEEVAQGRRHLPITAPADLGYEPSPGRITLTTQHSAKGLEWDAVFLVGVDGFWIPGGLEAPFLGVHDFLGGDPNAEITAQLRYLMQGDAGLYNGRSATDSAHIEIISERLRLLYVGITRAKRFLHLSRSRATRSYNKDRQAEPATVLGVLYQYLKEG